MRLLSSSGCAPRVDRYSQGIALAKRALVLPITASLAIGGSSIEVEAQPGSADPGAVSVRDGARPIDLNALGMEAEAIAVGGRTIQEEAASLSRRLATSGSPDQGLHAEAVSALRAVAKLSYRLAAPGEVLANAVATASARQLVWSAALGQALQSFHLAKGQLDQSAEELLQQIRIVRRSEAATDAAAAADEETAELRALIRSARRYETAQKALTAAISQLVSVLAPPVMRQTPTAGIRLSVYGFFDKLGPVEEGYGLYTYVLLAPDPGTRQRNVSFLKVLLGSTHRTDGELAALRPQLNIFYVPVHSRVQALVVARSSPDAGAVIAAADVYHYPQAEKLLFRLCMEPATSNPELCSSAWRGPYLLTVPEPLNDGETISPAHLFIDLSTVHEHAFAEFIRAIKQQVMRPDFTDRQKVDALRLHLLDITLKAADWLNPIKEGIAEIVFVGGETGK